MKTTQKHRHAHRTLGLIAALALVATVGVGCSSSGSTTASSTSSTGSAKSSGGSDSSGGCTTATNGVVTVVTKQFDFEPTCIELTGNRLKVTYDNQESGVKHNFDLKGAKSSTGGSATDLKAGPNIATITYVDLKPGTYTYVCDLHANMKGTLTVKAS